MHKTKLQFDTFRGYFDLNDYSESFEDYCDLLIFLHKQHIIQPTSYMRMHDSLCESIVFMGSKEVDVVFKTTRNNEVHCKNYHNISVCVLLESTAYISMGQSPLQAGSSYYNVGWYDWYDFSKRFKDVPEPDCE